MNEYNTELRASLGKLRRHTQLAPQDPDVRFVLAEELALAHQYEEATKELQTVIALAPNHLAARKLLEQLTGAARE